MRFEFATAGRIIFGPGTLAEVAPLAAGMGRRPFVLTAQNSERAAPLLKQLSERRLDVVVFSVAGEPTTDMALAGVQQARAAGCDLVLGIGGGSVVDTGKAVAALLTSKGMSLASLCGGLVLANAGLGAVHGFAGPIGGMFPAPHGVVCARLLPYVMATNVRALQARAPTSPALARYDEVAQIVTGRATASAADGVAWVQELCAALDVPSLSDYGLTPADFPAVIAQSQKASSMKGNPLPLTDEELAFILEQAL